MIRLLMLSRTYLQASGSGNHLCITELSQWQCTCKTDADTTTSSQHAQPSGVLRRRSDGLECAAWRPPRPVAQCRQFPEKAKDASVSECTWTLSALEALRNALYKLKTYLLTYLYSSIYQFKLGNLAHCNKYWISRHIFSCRLLVVGHISYLCSALCTLKPKKNKKLKNKFQNPRFFSSPDL